jgi:hypothetical protein
MSVWPDRSRFTPSSDDLNPLASAQYCNVLRYCPCVPSLDALSSQSVEVLALWLLGAESCRSVASVLSAGFPVFFGFLDPGLPKTRSCNQKGYPAI